MKNYIDYFIEFVDIQIQNNVNDIEEIRAICDFLCYE